MKRQLIFPIYEKYHEYLKDESRLSGKADSISFPENEEEILEVVNKMRESNKRITIQGGKTGIAGGAVPFDGHIMNLSNMNRVNEFIKSDDGSYFLRVEPGITLAELKKAVRKLDSKSELFWPVDPTEQTATVGGAAACNAKGICSLMYGDSKKYIEAARVALYDGTVKEIKRGENKISIFENERDLLELYLGSEGIYGILTELTLKLQPKPFEEWGISFFFNNKEDVFSFIDSLMERNLKNEGAGIAAVEYIDRAAINLIEERKNVNTKLKELPDVEMGVEAMVYIEIHGTDETAVEEIAEILMELAESCNSNPDKAWAVSGESEIEKLRTFRHAAAECANLFIDKMSMADPRITKLGTDMSLEGESFKTVIERYETGIENEGLRACIFGHATGNHLHVNLLPENYEEYKKGIELIGKWAEEISLKSGKVINEHGVGKLKKQIFLQNISEEYLQELTKLKHTLDPIGLWNPGNVLDRLPD